MGLSLLHWFWVAHCGDLLGLLEVRGPALPLGVETQPAVLPRGMLSIADQRQHPKKEGNWNLMSWLLDPVLFLNMGLWTSHSSLDLRLSRDATGLNPGPFHVLVAGSQWRTVHSVCLGWAGILGPRCRGLREGGAEHLVSHRNSDKKKKKESSFLIS